MRRQEMTEEKKGKRGRFFVVEHLHAGALHIAHPDRGQRDIALGPYEAKIVPYEEWKDAPFLDQVRDEGRVKTYWADKRPVPMPTLPPEAPMKVTQRNAIWTIAFGDGKCINEMPSGDIVEEDLAVMLINLIPEESTSYEGPGRRKMLSSPYLKGEHYETLHWAKWLIENFPRAPFPDRVKLIDKRMAEIKEMP